MNTLCTTDIADKYNLSSWSDPNINLILQDVTGPIASIPMKCKMCDSCPLSDPPIGKPCPVEMQMAQHLFFSYVSHLSITPSDYTDITLVWHLVRCTIQMRRFDIKISEEGVMKMFISGIDPVTGARIENEDLHPGLRAQEKLLKDTMTIMSKLLATRKDKVEAAAKGALGNHDAASTLAALGKLLVASESGD